MAPYLFITFLVTALAGGGLALLAASVQCYRRVEVRM